MKFSLLKDSFEEKLNNAIRFSMSRISSVPLLQGGLLTMSDGLLELISTNLNEFFYTSLKVDSQEKASVVLDIKKIVEFIHFLPSGKIDIEIQGGELTIQSGKTKAAFNTAAPSDFPTPPKIEGKKYILKEAFLKNSLPLILFSAAGDESRPILTGINFKEVDGEIYVVSTDGFRLSLLTHKKEENFPTSLIIPSHVLVEITRMGQNLKEVEVVVSESEKMFVFTIGDMKIYSRMIDGDFPPFQRVVPTTYKTKTIIDRDEFLRNIKLSSVFARELSNIIIFQIRKDGIYVKPKVKGEGDTVIFQEAVVEGDEQNIAFNFKFVLDFLNNVSAKKIIFEMTEKNAPGVFKMEENKNFLHIIMPVRTDDETTV